MIYTDIDVSGNSLTVSKPMIAENNVGTLSCRFRFDSEWEGFTKFAVFTHGDTSVAVPLDEAGVCEVPSQVMSDAGVVTFGVFGNSGGRRINSCLADLDLAAGAFTSASTVVSQESLSAYETAVQNCNTATIAATTAASSATTAVNAAVEAADIPGKVAEAAGTLPKLLMFTNKTVGSWTEIPGDTTGYPYMGVVICSGVTTDMMADVIFNVINASSGNFAPTCVTGAGVVYVYARSEPTSYVTIPTIKVVYNP